MDACQRSGVGARIDKVSRWSWRRDTPTERPGRAEARLLIPQRAYGGQVQVKAIINEHYATAIVISGEVNKYDLVELARQTMTGDH